MVGMIILAVIVMFTGWMIWMRRRRTQAYTTPVLPGGMSRENSALDVFAHGNSYLAEGKFDEAIAAFQKTLEIEPKHPHVAGRLAEVQRRQQAASATPPVSATV